VARWRQHYTEPCPRCQHRIWRSLAARRLPGPVEHAPDRGRFALDRLEQAIDDTFERTVERLRQHALDDIRAFAERIDTILQRGYTPHIDDGVLINMAPLWELIPSWQAEPKKCWEALARGDYNWAHRAMDHWPKRACDKRKTNRCYTIAHDLA
jgi:hypothetical protein